MTGPAEVEADESGSFSGILAEGLKASQIPQSLFALRLGVSQATVSRWLAGKVFPKDEMIKKIVQELPPEYGSLAKCVRRSRSKPKAVYKSASVVGKSFPDALDVVIDILTPAQLRVLAHRLLRGGWSPKVSQLIPDLDPLRPPSASSE